MTTWEHEGIGASKEDTRNTFVDYSRLTAEAKLERAEILSYQAAIAFRGKRLDLAAQFIAERDKIVV